LEVSTVSTFGIVKDPWAQWRTIRNSSL